MYVQKNPLLRNDMLNKSRGANFFAGCRYGRRPIRIRQEISKTEGKPIAITFRIRNIVLRRTENVVGTRHHVVVVVVVA